MAIYNEFGYITIDDARIDETCNAYFKWKDLNTYISNNSHRGINMPDAISEPMGCYCMGYLWNRCCAIAVSLFGGFFVATYLLDKISWNLFNKYIPKETLQVFVGYSMTVLFVLDIVNGLISIEILHWILQLYTVLVVFEGARRFLEIPENKLTSYTVVASILILVSPVMIEFVFNKLSVILN